jgi:hypothetical protein
MKQVAIDFLKTHGWKIAAFILLMIAVKFTNLEPKMVMEFLNDKSVINVYAEYRTASFV